MTRKQLLCLCCADTYYHNLPGSLTSSLTFVQASWMCYRTALGVRKLPQLLIFILPSTAVHEMSGHQRR